MAKNNKNPELEIADVEMLAYDAMRHCGMIPPMTIDEVAEIESQLDSIELPFSSSDPFELLKKLEFNETVAFPGTAQSSAVEMESVRNLARAAREGGVISAEVENRMAEDKAKHQQNDNAK